MDLIVFFDSTREIRYIVGKYQANLNGEVYKIEPTESIGFFTKLKNDKVAIKRCNLNLAAYNSVIIITSLWYKKIPSPVLRFLEQSTGRIKNVSYVLFNNNKEDHPELFDKMDRILNLRRGKSYFVSLEKKEMHLRVY